MLVTLCDKQGDTLWSLVVDAIPSLGHTISIESNHLIQNEWREDSLESLRRLKNKKFVVNGVHHRATVSHPLQQTTAIFIEVVEIQKEEA